MLEENRCDVVGQREAKCTEWEGMNAIIEMLNQENTGLVGFVAGPLQILCCSTTTTAFSRPVLDFMLWGALLKTALPVMAARRLDNHSVPSQLPGSLLAAR